MKVNPSDCAGSSIDVPALGNPVLAYVEQPLGGQVVDMLIAKQDIPTPPMSLFGSQRGAVSVWRIRIGTDQMSRKTVPRVPIGYNVLQLK